MIKQLRDVNSWFDGKPEPWRFLCFMVVILIPVAVTMAVYPPIGAFIAGIFATMRWIGT